MSTYFSGADYKEYKTMIDKFNQAGVNWSAYDTDYYSSSSTSIYFGDIWIDEVVLLGYNYVHDKTPLYGYASETWDTVCWGQKMVTGQLAINFKENAYLLLVLNWLENRDKPISIDNTGKHTVNRQAIETYIRNILARAGSTVGGTTPAVNLKGLPQQGQAVVSQQIIAPVELSVLESLYGFLDLGQPDSGENRAQDFEQVAEVLENQIWGGVGSSVGQLRTPTHHTPFDIFIVYGDYQNAAANHTSKKICEVHLTGQSQTIQVGPQNIIESYSFIAKDLDVP